MVLYVDEQMDFGRWDGCPVVGIFISTISRLWEKYHQQCKMMNMYLIHLRHYLNKRSRASPVYN